jgi:hypothetical protein
MSTEADRQASKKDSGRDGRLQFSNMAEHSLRKELIAKGVAGCKKEMTAFAECSKASGLMVIFNCRGENRTMNDCLGKYTSGEELERLKGERAREVAKTE